MRACSACAMQSLQWQGFVCTSLHGQLRAQAEVFNPCTVLLGAGIDIKIDGFSHKLPLLCRFVFTTLAGLAPDEDAFLRVKEALLRQVRAGGVALGRWSGRKAAEREPTCSVTVASRLPGCTVPRHPCCAMAPSYSLPRLALTCCPLPRPAAPSLLQYRNVNMKGLKHATYLRLMALKDLMWPAEAVQEVCCGVRADWEPVTC